MAARKGRTPKKPPVAEIVEDFIDEEPAEEVVEEEAAVEEEFIEEPAAEEVVEDEAVEGAYGEFEVDADVQPTALERGEEYIAGYATVIEGIVNIDVGSESIRLEDELMGGRHGKLSLSQTLTALDRVQDNAFQAKRLGVRARRDYENFKEQHQTWLELKKSAARTALEQEKKEKALKKMITNDMIVDQVRATWPDEFIDWSVRLHDFQAAVHLLEALEGKWTERQRALVAMKDILMVGSQASLRDPK